MRSFGFLAMGFALLCGGVAHGQESGAIDDPATLFSAACASGQARLPRSKFDDVAYAEMPAAARAAFAFSAKTPAKAAPAPFGDLEVPNRVLVAIPDRQLYLLLPAAGAHGAAAELCSVIWRGAHQADAVQVLDTFTGEKPAGAAPAVPAGASYTSISNGSSHVVAAELNQWTALTIVPSATPPKEQGTP